ncbi:MAG: NADH-quinone oxidoreductase subunit L [Armatimonadota bacterium]|nr:NADH-quinone oxidoreductase subunit L [Armatimonadota bacterium]MDR7447719.1 NADH-quinone oxidoreductase subunit L [Armatimonadota bacterium]MDR7458494.1 NADH-quinone oxidoreductase subunit L [Armatimonadota bacterium]MDR7479947.1 NADH-quinone oxidoreductase subunit L [Armatimonadota bacterium]MDR7488143.1 NADH-quinone oxidoreductase subunit L [Armatimonadota bacterium]
MSLVWLVPLLPFLACGLILARGRRLPGQGAYVAVGAMLLATVGGVILFGRVLAHQEVHQRVTWAVLGGQPVALGLQVDPLAAVMVLIVTVVGSLIFIYSIGYMHGDPRYPRFFAYLSLFAGAMLLLVLADNFLFLFAGWELVGLGSYLLIGFWFERPAAARAAVKAFVTTRVGDLFFFLGILLVFATVGSLGFAETFRAVEAGRLAGPTLLLAALCLFGGAVGKSAQIPLHVWLPDAMEGPTPVSALIHAATMVAAGVYLVARLFGLFFATADHQALAVVGWVGGITAFLAATMALVQDDIKRVLAYSTMSQLGYMFLGLGVLGYTAAVFHLLTHAFFKALLFLAAGSVIHAMHTNDIKAMGGLARVMPSTYWTFLVGTLALAGIFPFAGFWSKDEILLEAFHHHRPLFVLGLVTAALTAFYMLRVVFYTFTGRPRWAGHVHPHESPPVMTVPLWVLAAASATIGLVGVPALGNPFHAFVHAEGVEVAPFSLTVALLGTAAALLGIAAAAAVYHFRWVSAAQLRRALGPVVTLLEHRYYVDELYQAAVVRPVLWVGRALRTFDLYVIDGLVNLVGVVVVALARLYRLVDLYVVDGLVNLLGWTAARLGAALRVVQTGRAENYLLVIALGVIAIVIGGLLR